MTVTFVHALAALLLSLCQADPAALAEKLGSDRIDERASAVRALKALGTAAVPALNTAARSSDRELAERARQVLRLIAFSGQLTPRFRKAIPDAEERLDSGRSGELFDDATGFDAQGFLKHPTLTSEDLETPARLALEGKDPNAAVLDAVDRSRLKTVAPRMRELLAGQAEAPLKLRAASILCRHAVPADVPLIIRGAWSGGHLTGDTNALAHRARWTSLHLVAGWKGTPEAAGIVKDLKPFLTSKASGWAEGAVTMLAVLDAKDAAPDLVPLLAEGKPGDVRRAAVRALGDLDARDQAAALRVMMKNPFPNLKMEAARVLYGFGDAEGRDVLLSLAAGQSGFVQDSAREALMAGDAAALLAEIAKKPAGLLDVVGAIGGPAEAPLLATMMEGATRREAAAAAGYLQDPSLIPPLIGLLRDPDKEVRATAARALGRLRAREAIPHLDPATPEGFDALTRLHAKEAEPAARKKLSAPTYGDRIGASQALTLILGKAAEKDLFALLQDSDQYVRRQAAQDLGEIGSEAAIVPLKKMLGGGGYLRMTSAYSLCALGVREAAPAAIEEARWAFWQCWLLELNTLRSPAAWKKLGETPSKADLSGTTAEVLVRLGQEAGMTVEIVPPALPEARWWLTARVRRRTLGFSAPAASPSVRDVLECVLAYGWFDAILDGDKIRIMGRLEAQRDWEQWEESARNR